MARTRLTAILMVLAAAAVSFSPQALRPAAAQQPYLLGPGDVVEVVVYGVPELSRTVTVRPDGMISLPLIGDVQASGLTPDQLGARATEMFSRFVQGPRVTVIVREFRRIRVSVLGQVVRPGLYDLPVGATILDALASAQGVTPDAGLLEAKLIRGRESVPLDLERLLRGELDANRALENGDAVVIPEDLTSRVYVVGEVTRPGVFPLRGAMTVLQAIALAGGPTRRAQLNKVHLIRRMGPPLQQAETNALATVVVARHQPDTQIIALDLRRLLRDGDVAQDVALRRGDVVFVPDNPMALENIALLLGLAADIAFMLR